jgi:hypothetical protein
MSGALITDAGVATVVTTGTLAAVAAGQGMTFTVRNAALQSQVLLTDYWREGTHVGRIQISSPNLVPVANGIRINTAAGLSDFMAPSWDYQALIPQDTLLVQDTGTAADVDLVAIQSYYANLPGGQMTLKSPGDVVNQDTFVFGWPVAVTSGATAGNQGTALVTTTVDSSTANTWYALLGLETDVQLGVIGLSGVDTSQLLCGCPGDINPRRMRSYFVDKSNETGLPCIPMWNSANKGSTNIVAIDHATSVAANVTMILGQMPPNWTP